MLRATLLFIVAYVVAFGAAIASGFVVDEHSPIVVAAVANVVATIVIFGFSRAIDNSSVYDPYWSVVPPAICGYWALLPEAAGGQPLRQVVVLGLVGIWGFRLTFNFARRWQGLAHEDWRYIDLRKKHGKAFWVVSFLGIHFFPSVLIFLGSVPVFFALGSSAPLSWLDAGAATVTAVAIALEALSDRQLHDFVRNRKKPGEIIRSGLWRYSRHPNYFGEALFWFGLFLFGLGSGAPWWTVVGAVGISLLLRFLSIPMLEERMQNRAGYADHVRKTSALLLWPPRR